MLAAGLLPEDFGDTSLALWPENDEPINLFCSVSTQWRVGMAGPTGLDYTALFARMDRRGYDADTYERLFQDIRVIEAEALTIINTKEK